MTTLTQFSTKTSHEETNPNRERNLTNIRLWLNKIYPRESVENLYEAYVNFIDRFAYLTSDTSMYERGLEDTPEWYIMFSRTQVREKGTFYQFETVDLDPSFFWRVYLHLSRIVFDGQSFFSEDERVIIWNSMLKNTTKLLHLGFPED